MSSLKVPIIESERTISRLAHTSDINEIIEFHKLNDPIQFAKWGPEMPKDFYEKSHWEIRVERAQYEFESDESLRLLTFLKETNELIATINYTTFERGPFQNCRLGYKIGKKFEGQGLMKESLQASIQYVFNELQFHRIEANVIPTNERSRGLLKRLQFQESGISKNYLRINGEWQDHVQTYLINSNWKL